MVHEESIHDFVIQACQHFVRAVKSHTSLQELHLRYMSLDRDVTAVANILWASKHMKSLNFIHCQLGTDGMKRMSRFVRKNHPLEHLSLRSCRLTDSDAKELAI